MDAKLRIHIHQQVNMIRHDFELDQLGVASRAHPRDDLFQSLVRAAHQHRSAVFWTMWNLHENTTLRLLRYELDIYTVYIKPVYTAS